MTHKIYLACEGQEVLVDEFGGQAVASVLLGCLDVVVDPGLGLEPFVAALIWAGERAHTSVIHQMHLETIVCGIGR